MKFRFIIPMVLISLMSFPSMGETGNDIVKRNNLYFKKFTDVPFTGEIDDRFRKGSIRKGKKEGFWEQYYSDGGLSEKGNYINGRKDGQWERYDDNGNLWVKESYKGGKKDGFYIHYYENGQLFEKGNYKNDQLDGLWIRYHDNGELSERGNYKNGKKDGHWVRYLKKTGLVDEEFSGIYADGLNTSN